MRAKTSISIYKENLSIWNDWLQKKNMTSAEFIESLINHVKQKKQQELYKTLPTPHNFHKPLENIKLNKNYKKI